MRCRDYCLLPIANEMTLNNERMSMINDELTREHSRQEGGVGGVLVADEETVLWFILGLV